ncbi:MAG: acetylglutamate kinase [Elusimicrobia bacterium]|nr:acetylglutamate kinase [Elusimicrobiota bacterium]
MKVVKIGGEILSDMGKMDILKEYAEKNFPAAVVFGAGIQISERLKNENIPFRFYKGERITTKKMLAVITEEFRKAASVITDIFAGRGVYVEGGEIFVARRKSENLGFVGEVAEVKKDKPEEILSQNKIPVISPVGADSSGNLYNINADVSAAALAGSFRAEELFFLTKVSGVLDSAGVILSEISAGSIGALIEKGVVTGGMIPKVRSAANALAEGVGRVLIGETVIL